MLESASQRKLLLFPTHLKTNLDDFTALWGLIIIVCFAKVFPTEGA